MKPPSLPSQASTARKALKSLQQQQRILTESRARQADGKAVRGGADNIDRAVGEAARQLDDLRAQIVTLPPETAIEACDDGYPFLLFPVRLECRFITQGNARQLYLRIYPDAIGIDALDEMLTDSEILAGEAFWTGIWRCGGDVDRELAVWRGLAAVYGPNRATWIARNLAPHNETNAQGGSNRPSAPLLPDQALAVVPQFADMAGRPDNWSQAPRAIGLPDCFVAMGYVGGTRVFEYSGNLIPDTLFTGPDPAPDPNLAPDAVDPGMAWMVDFDDAVAKGMAMKIPLPATAFGGLDELIVLGIRGSATAQDGEDLIETLIRAHAYEPGGFGLLPQGTRTNDNGPATPAGTGQDVDAVYLREFRPQPAAPLYGDWRDRTDGEALTEALGIDPTVVRATAHADGHDQTDVTAMNTALWPATLGPFLEDMMHPLLPLDIIRQTRSFLTANVSGRGVVPAIRVGRQPYGITVTTALSRWVPDKIVKHDGIHERLADDTFRIGLHDLVMRVDTQWTHFAGSVACLGSGSDSQATLLDVLGLQPRSAEYFQRFAVSLDQFANAQAMFGSNAMSQSITRIVAASSAEVMATLGVNTSQVPDLYHKLFFNTAGKLTGPFVDTAPASETRALPALSESGQNYLAWLADSDVDTIRREDFGQSGGTAIAAPGALLYRLLRQGVQAAYWDSAWNYFDSASLSAPRQEPSFINIQQGAPNGSRYALLYQDAGILAVSHPHVFSAGTSIAAGLSHSQALPAHAEDADLRQVRRSCDWLATRPTAALTRAFAEHIDLCTYRLDAWELAFPAERLRTLRAPGKATARGLYTGAFGYLENLRPKAPLQPFTGPIPQDLKPADAGQPTYRQPEAEYVLAPSVNHAVTAAVLRNAYLTHASSAQPQAMAIDTSSRRVRRALDILDGVRNGQGIGEILGYYFERLVHDSYGLAEIDSFIYRLREKFPLASGQQVATPPGTPIQSVEARNVVDGRKLVRQMQATAGNTAYPFGFSDLPSASPAQRSALSAAAAELVDMLDGVSDLLLAESAYSAALGNFDRAGAALDALSGAETLAVPEVVATRRSGHGITHRLCLVLSGDVPPAAGASPRADMEPRLNAWLAQVFGDLSQVACHVTWQTTDDDGHVMDQSLDVSLHDLGLEPIDLLYIQEPGLTQAAGEMDTRLVLHTRRVRNLDDGVTVQIAYTTPVPNRTSLFELLPLIRSAKGLLLGRRRLGAKDFVPPSQATGAQDSTAPPDANPDGWLANTYGDRATTARAALGSLADGLDAQATLAEASPNDPAPPVAITALLTRAAGYGVSGALPAVPSSAALAAQARRVSTELHTRLDAFDSSATQATALGVDAQTEVWIAAVRALFGKDFVALPPFRFADTGAITTAVGATSGLLDHASQTDPFPLDTWLAGLARVRQAPAHLERLQTLTQAQRQWEPALTPLQLPGRTGDSWLGLELPPDYVFGDDSLLATTLFAVNPDPSAAQAGLLIDEWTEIIPIKAQSAGVAFRYDAPGAEAPQSLLLAVTPEITGAWQWDDLVATVRETMHMARNRAVEPRMIDQSALAQLLPMIMVPFTATGATFGTNLARATATEVQAGGAR